MQFFNFNNKYKTLFLTIQTIYCEIIINYFYLLFALFMDLLYKFYYFYILAIVKNAEVMMIIKYFQVKTT